jgi:trans-L-3-hydroxyproline dehydratase
MNWSPPAGWPRITTIDAHAAGEPLRIITGGLPPIPGDTILERRRFMRENLDYLRTSLMWEPRGHADMYGAILTDPVTPLADKGVLFLHNEGYSTMCGHGIIALVTVALETGMLPITGPLTTVGLDTPAGLVTAYANVQDGQVLSVAFENVPSFVYALDQTAEVPGIGAVRYDVAFGGAFYAYCRAADLGVGLEAADFRRLIEVGMAVKRAVMASLPIQHPFEEELSFLYGTILVGPAQGDGADSRNVCIFAEGEVDRSPTGTGVSGRLALRHARGRMAEHEPFVVESIIGTRFSGRIAGTTTFGGYQAIIPQIEGSAHITGRHEFLIDPDDPLGDGFILR